MSRSLQYPCREFFVELGVLPDQAAYGPFVKWHGSGVTILQGDFFDLNDTYDAAVDRGALVAVCPSRRVSYADHLKTRLTPGAPILLVVDRIRSRTSQRSSVSGFPGRTTPIVPRIRRTWARPHATSTLAAHRRGRGGGLGG